MSTELILRYGVTILSLLVAIITTYVSVRSLRIANKNAEATMATVDLFNQELEDNTVAKNMEFHYKIIEMFRNLQLQFPPQIGDPKYKPTAEDERLIFVFWFLIFLTFLGRPFWECFGANAHKNGGVKKSRKKDVIVKHQNVLRIIYGTS